MSIDIAWTELLKLAFLLVLFIIAVWSLPLLVMSLRRCFNIITYPMPKKDATPNGSMKSYKKPPKPPRKART